MECKRCGRETLNEEYCDECKMDVLNESIEENNKLNELEKTKVLTELENLEEVEPKLEDTIVFEPVEEKEDIDLKEEVEPKKSKKKIIIIVSVIVSIIIIISIILVTLLSKPNASEKVKEKEKIDSEKVINEYGKLVLENVESYYKENNKYPTFQDLVIDYKKYNVSCDVHEIYESGNIYLDKCKINNEYVEYSYGTREEVSKGIKLDIYKVQDSKDYYYSKEDESNAQNVGSITCKTDSCEYVSAFDKYVLIYEDGNYYIYNYEDNTISYGPFNMTSSEDYSQYLIYFNHTLYGIYANNEIYNLSMSKTFKDIKGSLELEEVNYNPTIMYKYGFVPIRSNNGLDFISLKNGKISYSITDNIYSYLEDSKNNVVYILTYSDSIYNLSVVNSNGKKLFENKTIESLKVFNDKVVISYDDKFEVYSSKLKKEFTSQKYEDILDIYDGYVAVLYNSNLCLVDYKDKVIKNFELEWTDDYRFVQKLSKLNKDKITLVIENKSIKDGSIGRGMEYTYNFSTKEVSVIDIDNVD